MKADLSARRLNYTYLHFLTESSASHAHFDFSNLVCAFFCARVSLLLEKSILCCTASRSKAFISTDPFQGLLCCHLAAVRWLLCHCILWSSQCNGLSELVDIVPKTRFASFWHFHSHPLHIIHFFFFNLKLLFCILLVTSILLHSKSRKQFK